MLKLHLKPILNARGIEKPYSFLRQNGFNHDAAINLVKGDRRNVNLNHLESLCEMLWCSLEDLFIWESNTRSKSLEHHPLYPLSQSKAPIKNIDQLLSKVPYKQLSSLNEMLTENIHTTLSKTT